MGSAPASLADNPFLITLLLEMQTTIFLRTEMSRKTEYVHNPCFLSANILKILGVFAENQILVFCLIISIPLLLLFSIDENTETWIKLRFVIFSALNTILILILHIIIDMGKSVFLITNALSKIEENSQKQ